VFNGEFALMDFTTPKVFFEDERGTIKDILPNETIDSITVIESKSGAVRGNHFHKDTIQWVYVASGRLQSLTQKEGEPVVDQALGRGDLLKTDPMEKHSITVLEDAEFYVFTRGPRSGKSYEEDTYRLDTPLQSPKT
jgi:dTDP-4-dehydrorhamnose 3,5-epimerase-like enzyme